MSATRVVQTELGDGSLSYAHRAPHRAVQPLLERDHIGFQQDAAPFSSWLEPPRPAPTLMISLEGRIGEHGRRLPCAWFAGMSAECSLPEMGGGRHVMLDLKLSPLGAHALGIPLAELTDAIVPLEDVLGPATHELVERLHELPDWDRRFELVDAFLLRRAEAGPAPTPAIAHAVRRLRETDGRLSIGALAVELRCSRRYLAQRFREQVGLGPKTFARLLRFDAVRRRIDAAPVHWADIAAECGYSDQAHLARDFRDLAGTTPTEYLSRLIPGVGVVGDGLHR